MKSFILLCGMVLLVHSKSAAESYAFKAGNRCVNMWDEGCINGQLPGSGKDDDYMNGGFNPGKRCVNMWDDGCSNGQLPGAGKDDDYMNGGFNPGKRRVNMWDDGCSNGQLPGAGQDDDYFKGGFNPGKRCIGENCNEHINLGKLQQCNTQCGIKRCNE